MELNGSGDRYGFAEEAQHKTMLNYGFETYAILLSKETDFTEWGNQQIREYAIYTSP